MVVPCGTSILGKAAKTALVGDMFGERSCVTFIGFLDPVRLGRRSTHQKRPFEHHTVLQTTAWVQREIYGSPSCNELERAIGLYLVGLVPSVSALVEKRVIERAADGRFGQLGPGLAAIGDAARYRLEFTARLRLRTGCHEQSGKSRNDYLFHRRTPPEDIFIPCFCGHSVCADIFQPLGEWLGSCGPPCERLAVAHRAVLRISENQQE